VDDTRVPSPSALLVIATYRVKARQPSPSTVVAGPVAPQLGGEVSQLHWRPVEAVYRIAFTTVRRPILRGRLRQCLVGMKGTNNVRSASVRSLAQHSRPGDR
jgi:hypothetical protein